MPRQSVSPFTRLQQQARRLLTGLAHEIQSRKGELTQLEQQYAQLVGIAGARGMVAKEARKAGLRIDWSQVLAKLPKEFKASDIRKVRGMKEKRSAEIFAGITRWIDSGTVKKKERGIYLRVK